MPSPRTATSCEVMPPFATTQDGCAGSAAWTTSMTAVDTVREMARLSSASPPRSRVRLVNSSTSEVASASIDLPADRGDVGVAPFRVDQRRHVQLGFGQPAAFLGLGDLAAGKADVRPDDDETVSAGVAGRPDLCCGQRFCGSSPASACGERRAAPVDEGLARRLRLEQAEHDDLQVGVVGGVDDDKPAAGDAAQGYRRPAPVRRRRMSDRLMLWTVRGDRRHRPAALFSDDEFAQVRRGIAERRVAGELAVSPPGSARPPTFAQWMSPAVNRPASK